MGGSVYAAKPTPSFRRMMVFIDGENLVFNYQKLLKNGNIPKNSVKHLTDVYVWEKDSILKPGLHEIIRAHYYTYATGSDEKINEINNEIKELEYERPKNTILPNYLYPVIFKKEKKQAKSKGVDIQMTVDILMHVYYSNIDTVYLIAGDGDYLPIISETIRAGKQVYLAFFLMGLNKRLKERVDQFHQLDEVYFQ